MRISVPTIPLAAADYIAKTLPIPEAVERIANFLSNGSVTVLTGAGVSVDSGIRAYRGSDGRYMNPNYKPIFYHELADPNAKGLAFRQRYWLRSYLGYPPIRDAVPNTSHYAIAALQHTNHVPLLVTQNVDGLHGKALSGVWNSVTTSRRILELHGTLHRVHCSHGHLTPRDEFQDMLSSANPHWKDFADYLERTGRKPRTNPDGDVALEGVRYDDFVVPDCPQCALAGHKNSVQKPEVIFFGESISAEIRDASFDFVERSDRLFIIGTTLATYSAFRLLKRAVDQKKPVLLLNVGPTRADDIPGVEKIELASGVVMREAAKALLGTRADEDPIARRLLQSGIIKPPEDDSDEDGEDVPNIRAMSSRV